MTRQLTHTEAWEDFWKWIRAQERWKDIPRLQKQYMYKAAEAYRKSSLGPERIRKILTAHAPDRYTFETSVMLHDENS